MVLISRVSCATWLARCCNSSMEIADSVWTSAVMMPGVNCATWLTKCCTTGSVWTSTVMMPEAFMSGCTSVGTSGTVRSCEGVAAIGDAFVCEGLLLREDERVIGKASVGVKLGR